MTCDCNKTIKVKVKYHDTDNSSIKRMEKISIGNWIDLYAAETVTLEQFEHKVISLGFAMQLPPGYEANIVPRSSTFKNFGIIQANHFAVIDASYRGDSDIWGYSVIALRSTEIKEGDKICQFRLNKIQPDIEVEFVPKLLGTSRGGFGTTGKR